MSKPIYPTFIYEFTVLEHHLDTFGHVNNATYVALFEQARWDLVTRNGYGLKEVYRHQIGPVVLGMDIQFKKEVRLREQVRIASTLLEYEGKIGKMRQILFNEQGEEACIKEMVFGLMDLKARKLILPTREWRKAIGCE